ncbi:MULTISPECIES: hypothetical protein [Sanguibacteroides]|uniref:hypothetical protein n=1 Tax=Sanguibacteroides TaxID=1635148 RepID=UPI000B1A4E88|nr:MULTISPECIES: hypothetical protein [Sanguibacteroides]
MLKTIYGIRFHNDPDGSVYPYISVSTMLVDKQHPRLQEFFEKWFKSPEGNVHGEEAFVI